MFESERKMNINKEFREIVARHFLEYIDNQYEIVEIDENDENYIDLMLESAISELSVLKDKIKANAYMKDLKTSLKLNYNELLSAGMSELEIKELLNIYE